MEDVRRMRIMRDEIEVYIREATARDTNFVVACQRAMLQDMASYGGHGLNDDAWIAERLRADLRESLDKEDSVILLAALHGEEDDPLGMVEAYTVHPYDIFEPKLVLHIRSVYVEPGNRGEGVGRGLLEAVLEWGKRKGCVEAELNTLVGNPARRLYERMGFEEFQMEMRLRL
jgi:GNAT superfamily N-acetyltransferase